MGYLKGILLAFGLVFFGFTAFLLSLLALAVSPISPKLRFRANYFFLFPFGWYTRLVLGLKVIVLNRERIDTVRPAILVGNHQSGTDLGIIGSVCPAGSVIVAKKELQNIPIFGWYFKIAGNVLIDRKKTIEAKNQMENIREVLAKRNLNLVVFPEGTRSKTQALLPFKKGAFHIAISTGYPLVPVVCSNLSGKADWESFGLKGGHIVISVLEPIETKHLTAANTDEFRNRVQSLMSQEFERVTAMATRYDQDPKSAKSASCCS